jgi:hypothetical protein
MIKSVPYFLTQGAAGLFSTQPIETSLRISKPTEIKGSGGVTKGRQKLSLNLSLILFYSKFFSTS